MHSRNTGPLPLPELHMLEHVVVPLWDSSDGGIIGIAILLDVVGQIRRVVRELR